MAFAINLELKLVVDDHGNVLPITNWFDADGDECAPDDALACVAGTGELWYAVNLCELKKAPRESVQ